MDTKFPNWWGPPSTLIKQRSCYTYGSDVCTLELLYTTVHSDVVLLFLFLVTTTTLIVVWNLKSAKAKFIIFTVVPYPWCCHICFNWLPYKSGWLKTKQLNEYNNFLIGWHLWQQLLHLSDVNKWYSICSNVVAAWTWKGATWSSAGKIWQARVDHSRNCILISYDIRFHVHFSSYRCRMSISPLC